ncbi:MAG: hypothetical protein PHT80_06835 [Lentisphaeria bacterium]|nr:hypothetical protein [Lentisphaeria bacterium]
MRRRLEIIRVCCLGLAGVVVSGAVHESGHALVAAWAGLDIVRLQLWIIAGPPHVLMAGETTRSSYAAIAIAGMLLTVLVGLFGTISAGLLTRKWPPARWVIVFFFPMLCQSLAWVILPLAIILGAPAPKDDVTTFMRDTGLHAIAILAIGLAVTAIAALALRWAVRSAITATRTQSQPSYEAQQ